LCQHRIWANGLEGRGGGREWGQRKVGNKISSASISPPMRVQGHLEMTISCGRVRTEWN
jgi:hypothetical protein